MTREEAIENIKKALPLSKTLEESFYTLHPELAESEDERIRQAIIALVQWAECFSASGVTHEATETMLAWLEKQKEQKPNIEICPHSIKSKSYKENFYPIEDCDYGLEIAYDILEKTFGEVRGYQTDDGLREHQTAIEAVRKAKEQKPAEDKSFEEWIDDWWRHNKVNNPDSYDKGDEIQFDERGFKNFCRGIRNMYQQKPEKFNLELKQEWNEKDYREEDIQTRFAFYTYKDDPSVLYLSNVFVEESSRNHGFGTRILKAAEKVAEAIGAITISLKVKQNSPANAWYRKNGYGYVAFEDGYDWLEKNLEYLKPKKPVEWSEEDALNRAYEEGFNDGLKYREPANRSDEDRKMAHWLIGLVNANTELSFSDKTNLTRWLEHLTIEKELSKNDKRIMDAIMIGYQDKDFRSSQIPTPIGVSKDEVIDWLKSLRPQSKQDVNDMITQNKKFFQWIYDRLVNVHKENPNVDYMISFKRRIEELSFDEPSWKPSEEQMEALDEYIYAKYPDTEKYSKAILSLKEELKKLM